MLKDISDQIIDVDDLEEWRVNREEDKISDRLHKQALISAVFEPGYRHPDETQEEITEQDDDDFDFTCAWHGCKNDAFDKCYRCDRNSENDNHHPEYCHIHLHDHKNHGK